MNAQRVFMCTSEMVSLSPCRQLADFRDYGSCVSPLQVETIKQVSQYVSQLRRVGKGHGKS